MLRIFDDDLKEFLIEVIILEIIFISIIYLY